MEEKRTKIICTIGPASAGVSTLARMMKAGMNVARLNFSHGTHKDHEQIVRHVRAAARKSRRTIALLQDLQGPKIRVGVLPESGIRLRKGQKIEFSTATDDYKAGGPIPLTYRRTHKDVKAGNRILMDDGLLEARVEKIKGRVIHAKVVTGGILKSHKGMNLPDSKVSASAFTEKDHDDLLFGLEQRVDWIALSFVTSVDVIEKVRNVIRAKCRSLGTVQPKIIVKIERQGAIDNIDSLLDSADGIMIARGDLGIEIPFEEVPIVQKEIIEKCRMRGVPVVVATQMLDSMTQNPRSTRAETSDVANAVIDHADAVMLSGETATGKYPETAVKIMSTIVREAEKSRFDDISFYPLRDVPDESTSFALALLVMAQNAQIDGIASSCTYKIAQKINIFRPEVPIFLACPNEAMARQSLLGAGIWPIVLTDEHGTFVHRMEGKLRRENLIKKSARVAYVGSAPTGEIQLIVR